MDRESRIAMAKARIKELKLLIDAWTPKPPEPEKPQTMQGLRITPEDLEKMKAVTARELEEYFSIK